LTGVLAGALVSGVQMAISMSNTGGAWDNAKKYIEVRVCLCFCLCVSYLFPACFLPVCLTTPDVFDVVPQAGNSEQARSLGGKGSDAHKAAVIGDTVGDPLKDTSGPSLNILIKLSAILSLVFAPFFVNYGGILV
ncbi:MAG: sodium/proton-translocating pyrophosphatase, partial [Pseudohongiellaceae bacterium]